MEIWSADWGWIKGPEETQENSLGKSQFAVRDWLETLEEDLPVALLDTVPTAPELKELEELVKLAPPPSPHPLKNEAIDMSTQALGLIKEQ